MSIVKPYVVVVLTALHRLMDTYCNALLFREYNLWDLCHICEIFKNVQSVPIPFCTNYVRLLMGSGVTLKQTKKTKIVFFKHSPWVLLCWLVFISLGSLLIVFAQ